MLKSFIEKLNPMNFIEKWVIKRLAKKIAKSFPDLKMKGVDFIEKNAQELFEKIEIAIAQFIKKFEDK